MEPVESVWYYVVNGVQSDPVSWEELQRAALTGKLSPDDLVWKEGTPDWVAARTVPDLFASASTSSAAPVVLPPSGPSPQPRTAPLYSITEASIQLPPEPSLPKGLEPLPIDDDDPSRPRRKRDRDRDRDRDRGRERDRDRGRDRDRNRDRDRDRDVTPAEMPELVKLIPVLFMRAFTPDPSKAVPAPGEEAALTRTGVMDPVARKYAVWRRAMLLVAAIPCVFAALFSLIHVLAMDKEQREPFSLFGMLLLYIQAFALFVLPAAAVAGALLYDRLGLSALCVLAGGLVSFVVPLGVAFMPGDWVIDLKEDSTTTVQQMNQAKAVADIYVGTKFYLLIVPAVLSLLPAVSRACIRMKLLLPESLVPGWGLVMSAPLCVLLTLATFVLIYHIAGNAVLLLGLILWIGGPLLYLVRFNLLTRPVTTPTDKKVFAQLSFAVFGLIGLGMILLLVYVFTHKIALVGKTLVGFDEASSVLRPWSLEIHKKWIEYVGRSLFLSVFFSDLVIRVALSVWREHQAFGGTPQAAKFDQSMSGIGAALLPRGGAPVAPADDEKGEPIP